MLNLREGNVPGLTRAAHLRELHGMLAGALVLLQEAYDRLPPSESEDRASVLAQMSHVELLQTDIPKAESYATAALVACPDYDLALGALAEVRIAQSRYADAATLQRQRYEAAPRTETLYSLAEALELAGRKNEAQQYFREFERQALAQSDRAENANRKLIYYYVDHAGEPAKALDLARREINCRHDVFTLDAYAWALAASGDYTAANLQLKKPLAMGIRDPRLLSHAASIASHLPESGNR
jgi:tetratricopeptide (TPR) repeat protein